MPGNPPVPFIQAAPPGWIDPHDWQVFNSFDTVQGIVLFPNGGPASSAAAIDTNNLLTAIANEQYIALAPGNFRCNTDLIGFQSNQTFVGSGANATSISYQGTTQAQAQIRFGDTSTISNSVIGGFQTFGNANSGHAIQWRAQSSYAYNITPQSSQLDLIHCDPRAISGGTNISDNTMFQVHGIHPGGGVSTPGVPASGSGNTVTNTTSGSVTVTVIGGTGTNVFINGVAQGTFDGTYTVPTGQTIALLYSSAPTWAWSGFGSGLSLDAGNFDSDYYSFTFDGGVAGDSAVGANLGFSINGNNNRFFGCHPFLFANGGAQITGTSNNWFGGECESNGTADMIFNAAHSCTIKGCNFYDHANPSPPNQNILFTGTVSSFIDIDACPYVSGGFTVPNFAVNSNSSNNINIHNCQNFNPVGVLTPPTFTSGSATTNTFMYPVQVFTSGTTAVSVGGSPTGIAAGTFYVAPGQTITPTTAGSWTWFGL